MTHRLSIHDKLMLCAIGLSLLACANMVCAMVLT